MSVYAYRWQGKPADLPALISRILGDAYFVWTADPAELRFERGPLVHPLEQGACFNPNGEVRWVHLGDEIHALILLDQALDPAMHAEGIESLPGSPWPSENGRVILQSLTDRQVHPSLSQYPHGQPDGDLQARWVKHPSGWRLISPRRFATAGEGRASQEDALGEGEAHPS